MTYFFYLIQAIGTIIVNLFTSQQLKIYEVGYKVRFKKNLFLVT